MISGREDDGGAGNVGGFTYDVSLASMHSYLGGRYMMNFFGIVITYLQPRHPF